MGSVCREKRLTKRGLLKDIAADFAVLMAGSWIYRSETDARGTFPLHVAAEFGQAAAAELLLNYGADTSLLDLENDAIALCWATFFGRPGVVGVLLAANSDPNQRNKHGLTSLGCAIGGTQGRLKLFSNASLDDWKQCADAIKSYGGAE